MKTSVTPEHKARNLTCENMIRDYISETGRHQLFCFVAIITFSTITVAVAV